MKSDSYKKATCCSVDCDYFGCSEQPCWGEVEVVDQTYDGDGEFTWVHACQGHADMTYNGKYIPEIK